MPIYRYIAKTLSGVPKEGSLGAKNEKDLARVLRQEGYILISAEEEKKKGRTGMKISIPLLDRISLVDKIMFSRNLGVMVKAGISLPRALGVLSIQAKSKKFKKAINEISEEVTKGKNFSQTLSGYPSIFSELFCSMVKVGEESGTLEQVLQSLTEQMEKSHELKSKIKGAMIYPAVIISAMVAIGILMLAFIVPQLAKTFSDLQIQLPVTTRAVIKVGEFSSKFWYLIPLIVMGAVFLLRFLAKTRLGKRFLDKIFLKMPLISPIVVKTNSAYTVRNLSSLVSVGVPIVKSLELVSGSLSNIYYREAIKGVAEDIKKGAKMGEAFKKCQNIYPALVIQMIEVGEETGETVNILSKLAEFFEEEVSNQTKNLSTVIEPLLMIIVGIAVGFFAVSMLQPMYSMIEGMK